METLQKELDDLCHMIKATVFNLMELHEMSIEEYAQECGIPRRILEAIYLLQFDQVSYHVVRTLVGTNTARLYEKLTRLAKAEQQLEWEALLHKLFFSQRR